MHIPPSEYMYKRPDFSCDAEGQLWILGRLCVAHFPSTCSANMMAEKN